MNIKLITLQNEKKLDSVIAFIDHGKEIVLNYYDHQTTLSAVNQFPFFALIQLRRQLQEQGKVILCNGSRIDVYPSGGSAIGLMAYELKMGEPATKLVNIFSPCNEIAFIGSVEEQKDFRERWIKSINAIK